MNLLLGRTMYERIQYDFESDIKFDLRGDEKASKWKDIFFGHLPEKSELPKVDGIVKVLDFGCNTGYYTRKLEDIYGYCEGVDLNPRLIEHSKLNSGHCKIMDIKSLKYDDNSFSLVTAKDVLEHSDAPDKAIKEAYRVLIEGGTLLCMIPLDGESKGIDDVVLHASFNYGNNAHQWKATLDGVMERLFVAGFTDLKFSIYHHSTVTGEERGYGDRVLVVAGIKKSDIIMLPFIWLMRFPGWAFAPTMRCNSNCSYCIGRICVDEWKTACNIYNNNELGYEEWCEFLNRLQKFSNTPLGIMGGEPTLYDGLIPLLNGIFGFHTTINTNLATPMFNDIQKFGDSISDVDDLRINASFHPGVISVDDFSARVHSLRDCEIYLDKVFIVDHPSVDFAYYCDEFVKRGIAVTPLTFLGKFGDTLLPKPEVFSSKDHKDHDIDNFDLYEAGFSCREKRGTLCSTTKFMIAPNGNIHRCHYHLYSNSEPFYTKQEMLEWGGTCPDRNLGYSVCKDFGFCNPCDFANSDFRSLTVDIGELLLTHELGDSGLLGFYDVYIKPYDDINNFILKTIELLYLCRNPRWELYNGEEFIAEVNRLLYQDTLVNNFNAYILGHLEYYLFKHIKGGINIFRILDTLSLCKYIEGTAAFYGKGFLHTNDILSSHLSIEGGETMLEQKLSIIYGSLSSARYDCNEVVLIYDIENDKIVNLDFVMEA